MSGRRFLIALSLGCAALACDDGRRTPSDASDPDSPPDEGVDQMEEGTPDVAVDLDSDGDGPVVAPDELQIVLWGEGCGDWEAAPVTEPATIPTDVPIPSLKWVYHLTEDPRSAELWLPGNILYGSASLALDGSVCFPILSSLDWVGCIGPDASLRWADGTEPFAVFGYGVAAAPDGSVWWLGMSGDLHARSVAGDISLAHLSPQPAQGFSGSNGIAIGPMGTVVAHGGTTPSFSDSIGVTAVSACMDRLWEAGPDVQLGGATRDGFWLTRDNGLHGWLVSPAGEILVVLPPPPERTNSERHLVFPVSDELVMHFYQEVDYEHQVIVGGALYRRRAPTWAPELIGEHNWQVQRMADRSQLRVRADGTLLGAAVEPWPPVEYELVRPDGTSVRIAPPGVYAGGGAILGANGELVFVRDTTNWSTRPYARSGVVVVYTPEGAERHRLVIEEVAPRESAAVLGRDGTLYFSGRQDRLSPDGDVYTADVVVAVQTDVPGEPVAGWSQARGNAWGTRSTIGP